MLDPTHKPIAILRSIRGCSRSLERRLDALAGKNWHRADIEQVLMSLHTHTLKLMELWNDFAEAQCLEEKTHARAAARAELKIIAQAQDILERSHVELIDTSWPQVELKQKPAGPPAA